MTTSLSLSNDNVSRWNFHTSEVLNTLDSLPKDAYGVSVSAHQELATSPIFAVTHPFSELDCAIQNTDVTISKDGKMWKGTLRLIQTARSNPLAIVETGKGGVLVSEPDSLEFPQLTDGARLQILSPASGLHGATVSCMTNQVRSEVDHLFTLDDNNAPISLSTTVTLTPNQRMSVDVITYTEKSRPSRVMAERAFARAPAYESAPAAPSVAYPEESTRESLSVMVRGVGSGPSLVLPRGVSTAIVLSKRAENMGILIAHGRFLLNPASSIDKVNSQLGAVLALVGLENALSGTLRAVRASHPELSYETELDAWSPTPNDFLALRGSAPVRLEAQRKDGSTLKLEREGRLSYVQQFRLTQTTAMRAKTIVELVALQPIVSIESNSRDIVVTNARPAEIPERLSNPDAYYLILESNAVSTQVALTVVLKM